jgi:aminoglycoside 6-adenylyltransferase
MRTEQEIMNIILTFAKNNDDIRVVTMEGSKLNKNVPVDKFQDFDIAFIVTDIEKYKANDDWLDVFGERVILQKPEAMPMFPLVWLGKCKKFSYLMVYEDGNKIDLTLVPLNEFNYYLAERNSLFKILIDKDNICPSFNEPSDIDFHVKKPSADYVDNCCNEFWHLSIYVTKGLCRNELLYAIKHLDLMKEQMFTMASWEIGIETSFSISVGKLYKYLNKYISKEAWEKIIKTYKNDTIDSVWDSLIMCCNIFQETTKLVSEKLNYKCPKYNKSVIKFIKQFFPENKAEKIIVL